MNLIVFGAPGPSGHLMVEQALEQGHAVTTFARNPADLPIQHEKLPARVSTSTGSVSHTDCISRADEAGFLLRQLSDDTYLRKTPVGLSY